MDNEELYLKYFSNELSETEKYELKQILLHDPNEFYAFMEDSALFVEASEDLQLMQQEDSTAGTLHPKNALLFSAKPSSQVQLTSLSQKKSPLKYILTAVAALIIVSLLIITQTANKAPSVDQKVATQLSTDQTQQRLSASLSGDTERVFISRLGKELPATKGMALQLDDIICNRGHSIARISYQDGTNLSLEKDSWVQLSVEKGSKHVSVKGSVRFDVRPQVKPMLIASDFCQVTVLGTIFTMDSSKKKSSIKLHRGRLSVTDAQNMVTELATGDCLISNHLGSLKSIFHSVYGVQVAALLDHNQSQQALAPNWDISKLIDQPGVYDFFFRQGEQQQPLSIDEVRFLNNGQLHSTDAHPSITSSSPKSKKQSAGIFPSSTGASMYRLIVSDPTIGNWTIHPKFSSKPTGGTLWIRYTDIRGSSLTFPASSNGNNLALNKKSRARVAIKSYPPSNANDGDISQNSAWKAPMGPTHWQVDLGSVKQFSKVHIYPDWLNNQHTNYIVKVSKKGKKWRNVVAMDQINLPPHIDGTLHQFAEVSARYVRVDILPSYNILGTSMVEIKVLK